MLYKKSQVGRRVGDFFFFLNKKEKIAFIWFKSDF